MDAAGAAERLQELQALLRTEQAANAMHQKHIQELERRLRLHKDTHVTRSSNVDVEGGRQTISRLKEELLHYREGLRQVTTILDEGVDLSHSSADEVLVGHGLDI